MAKHPHELLDIVDDENEVVGTATRQEIHDQGLPHRSIHLILTTGNGHFLLQQRTDSMPTNPGRWDSSAAGHVAAGSGYDPTVVREAEEEIGYQTTHPIPLLLLDASPETDQEWVQFYVEQVTSEPALKADPKEVQALRWWPEAELVEALVNRPDEFTPVMRTLFFLWRETGFLIPEKRHGNWYGIADGNADELQVRRSFLESAGLPARVDADEHWLAPQGGRTFFGREREARHTALCVAREFLPDAVALLYLSRPADGELV